MREITRSRGQTQKGQHPINTSYRENRGQGHAWHSTLSAQPFKCQTPSRQSPRPWSWPTFQQSRQTIIDKVQCQGVERKQEDKDSGQKRGAMMVRRWQLSRDTEWSGELSHAQSIFAEWMKGWKYVDGSWVKHMVWVKQDLPFLICKLRSYTSSSLRPVIIRKRPSSPPSKSTLIVEVEWVISENTPCLMMCC